MCCFISCWHQPNRTSSFSQHPPNQKTPQISMYRLHMPYQYKNIHKLYRSQLSRSKYNYKSQCTGQHQTQGGMGSPREHGTPRVHPSRGVWVAGHPPASGGSLLIQPTVEVHGNCHGCNLGVERCKSAPLNLTFPPLSQHGFGSQPTTPSALGGRAGCAQGRKFTSLELQVVLRAAAAPRAPQGWSQPHLQAQGGSSTAVLRHSPPRQQCRLPPHPPPLRWS